MLRRSFLAALPFAGAALASDSSKVYPSELKRYPDPATEFEVLRLTDPAFDSYLPAHYNRAVSKHTAFMLYASARAGSQQAYRLDLKTGESKELTQTAVLPASLSIAADERTFFYSDGNAAYQHSFNSPHGHAIYEAAQGAKITALSVADDATYVMAIESASEKNRLKLIHLGKSPEVTTIVETDQELAAPMPRPKRAGILYRRGQEWWLVNYDGAQNRRLRIAPGLAGPAIWSADGPSFFYLNYPEGGKALHNIREFTPDANDDRQIANTTQFVQFNRNADASVFVGASGSKASPYVLLLVRSVKRELTLCEHKCSDPVAVSPVFSPNSQRVFFQSDRHGKMAIYAVRVDRLVEETEG
ncbi:MAG TPA: hypothetical protein VKU01_33200 [Bryobacteraceae bacterium]|nr:hypothetical protein [Bryobacteraceae bacterium]